MWFFCRSNLKTAHVSGFLKPLLEIYFKLVSKKLLFTSLLMLLKELIIWFFWLFSVLKTCRNFTKLSNKKLFCLFLLVSGQRTAAQFFIFPGRTQNERSIFFIFSVTLGKKIHWQLNFAQNVMLFPHRESENTQYINLLNGTSSSVVPLSIVSGTCKWLNMSSIAYQDLCHYKPILWQSKFSPEFVLFCQ